MAGYRILWAICLAASGCGGDEIERIPTRGVIHYQGKAIVSGDVRFVPLGEVDVPQAGARIDDGRYEVHNGVPVGVFRVEVYAYRHSDGSPGAVDLQSAEAAYEQYLPARFNTQSELRLTIESGAPPQEKNFDLN